MAERRRVLVLGGGGREHALATFLARSPEVEVVYTAPGNAGTPHNLPLDSNRAESFPALACFAREQGVGLVVAGPELPLCLGVADALEGEGIPVFGPVRAAARLEGDKAFARRFMERWGIPQPRFAVFDRWPEARAYLSGQPDGPIVVKAAGLAAGKGAVVCGSRGEALEAAERAMRGRAFGEAGERLVVEEFMEGEEASILAVCDGKRAVYLPSSQDHKRALDGDHGPNTGGMGAYAPAPVVGPGVLEQVDRRIVRPVLEGMAREGSPYRGCLYVGLMVKDGEARVVEFNCRFGDPETQAVLPLVEADMFRLLAAAAGGRLVAEGFASAGDGGPALATARRGAACCVVMASGGYPDAYRKGLPIRGLDEAAGLEGLFLFHAGTAAGGGGAVTAGGRVLGVTGVGHTIRRAVERAYAGVAKIHFDGAHYRTDIGHRALGG